MKENAWWSTYVKPRWHNLNNRWVARKVQDVTNKGAPDVDACWNGFSCKVELKYIERAPSREGTKLTFSRYSKDEPNRLTILSREQLRNLAEWKEAGGNAFVLIGVNKCWFLLDAALFANPKLAFNDGMTLTELSTEARILGSDFKSLLNVPLTLGA